MTAKVSFTQQELMVIREAIHSITIRGSDAVLVGATLNKVYKAIEETDKPDNTEQRTISAESPKK